MRISPVNNCEQLCTAPSRRAEDGRVRAAATTTTTTTTVAPRADSSPFPVASRALERRLRLRTLTTRALLSPARGLAAAPTTTPPRHRPLSLACPRAARPRAHRRACRRPRRSAARRRRSSSRIHSVMCPVAARSTRCGGAAAPRSSAPARGCGSAASPCATRRATSRGRGRALRARGRERRRRRGQRRRRRRARGAAGAAARLNAGCARSLSCSPRASCGGSAEGNR